MYIFAPVPGVAITAAKIPAHLTMDLIYALDRMYQPGGVFGPGISSGPGGGGPGHSPISTNPPPSIEAIGASFRQSGKSGGPASSMKRRSRPRRRCPYYWHNGKWVWTNMSTLYYQCYKDADHIGRHRYRK